MGPVRSSPPGKDSLVNPRPVQQGRILFTVKYFIPLEIFTITSAQILYIPAPEQPCNTPINKIIVQSVSKFRTPACVFCTGNMSS